VMSRESLLDWLKEPPEPVVSGSPEDVWVGF